LADQNDLRLEQQDAGKQVKVWVLFVSTKTEKFDYRFLKNYKPCLHVDGNKLSEKNISTIQLGLISLYAISSITSIFIEVRQYFYQKR